MTEKQEEKVQISAPFTAEQIARIKEIVREELAKYEKQQIQKLRFGLPINAETK